MPIDLRATAVSALLLLPASAFAQSGYANAPFRDAPVAVAQVAAIERIETFARALSAVGTPAADEDHDEEAESAGGEDGEGGPLADFALFRGSLAAASPDLEQMLATAIGTMVEGGAEAAEAAEAVILLAGEARTNLVTPSIDDAPAFRAALMAALLLDEGGVAEGYEEAVEGEATAYATGYFALQRVKALWEDVAGSASPEQSADAAMLLGLLDDLFLDETPPETMSPDPEQAEVPAQQIVGVLEAVTDADLYPGRDLAGAAVRVHDIAAQGCAALEGGDATIGVESLTIAAAYYGSTVADTLGVMAPEAGGAVAEGLAAMQEGEAAEAAATCAPLLDALARAEEALTP